MKTEFIHRTEVNELTTSDREELLQAVLEAARQNLWVSPRVENWKGEGLVLSSVTTMTEDEYHNYLRSGGWDYELATSWLKEEV